jgi:Relaxase/Mobilisation nuclease domain
MPKALASLGGGPGLLEVASYGRRGPGRRDRFSSIQVGLIARTVHRAPEVMVKVLTQGGQDLKAVGKHLSYLSRHGELEIETDEGQSLSGKSAEKALLEDWDLRLDAVRRTAALTAAEGRQAPKLAHKLMFSMPPGTPPQKVLSAVKALAREQFALKHRYAMVLHTDEPHPHVHVVVKAMSENGTRLNIRKGTLRTWRREFARHLREQGVEVNATDRASRGSTRIQKLDGIYRAQQRGVSSHIHQRALAVARELAAGAFTPEPARQQLLATRREVLKGWAAVARTLEGQREPELAAAVRRFAREMSAPLTEKEQIAAAIKPRGPEKADERSRGVASRGSGPKTPT